MIWAGFDVGKETFSASLDQVTENENEDENQEKNKDRSKDRNKERRERKNDDLRRNQRRPVKFIEKEKNKDISKDNDQNKEQENSDENDHPSENSSEDSSDYDIEYDPNKVFDFGPNDPESKHKGSKGRRIKKDKSTKDKDRDKRKGSDKISKSKSKSSDDKTEKKDKKENDDEISAPISPAKTESENTSPTNSSKVQSENVSEDDNGGELVIKTNKDSRKIKRTINKPIHKPEKPSEEKKTNDESNSNTNDNSNTEQNNNEDTNENVPENITHPEEDLQNDESDEKEEEEETVASKKRASFKIDPKRIRPVPAKKHRVSDKGTSKDTESKSKSKKGKLEEEEELEKVVDTSKGSKGRVRRKTFGGKTPALNPDEPPKPKKLQIISEAPETDEQATKKEGKKKVPKIKIHTYVEQEKEFGINKGLKQNEDEFLDQLDSKRDSLKDLPFDDIAKEKQKRSKISHFLKVENPPSSRSMTLGEEVELYQNIAKRSIIDRSKEMRDNYPLFECRGLRVLSNSTNKLTDKQNIDIPSLRMFEKKYNYNEPYIQICIDSITNNVWACFYDSKSNTWNFQELTMV